MARKKRKSKTNALRLLAQQKITVSVREFPWEEKHLDALTAAQKMNLPAEQLFKTIVTVGNETGPLVAVIPASAELDLKKMAQLTGNKKVELLALQELQETTGYERGGCSPVGMKKLYPTYLAEEASRFSEIYVSAGQRGLQMGIDPKDLLKITDATTVALTKK